MISWLPFGIEYSASDVAIEDINANPDILPNTILSYTYVNHNLDAAVRFIYSFLVFATSNYKFSLIGCCQSHY